MSTGTNVFTTFFRLILTLSPALALPAMMYDVILDDAKLFVREQSH